MTVEEIESACDAARPMDFSRHPLEGAELDLRATFYPLGFPTEVRTNSQPVLAMFDEAWAAFEKRFDTKPIRGNVRVVESDSRECPPAPTYRFMWPLLVTVADADNYSVIDFEKGTTWVTVSRAAEMHPPYLRHFFLDAVAGTHISTRYATPIHAGCVALDGRGVLLCGDSGAGKSSLSYACARSGWTYTSDDASFLLNGGGQRIIAGDCHQVRMRPSAGDLFPEMKGLEITPRAAGKPSIQLPTAPMPHMACSQMTQVDFMVFLNRRGGGPPQLRPYRKDVARQYMRQVLFGSAESRAVQYEAIERLLSVEVLELRYTELDWAVERLRTLVQEGR